MNVEKLYESIYDVYSGDPIGGACAIWFQGAIRILTAYHVSHDTKKNNTRRALILRNRSGQVTLRNIGFEKVKGAKDLSLSEPLDLHSGLSVATRYARNNGYVTVGSAVSLLPNTPPVVVESNDMFVSMRKAPKRIYTSSKGQKVDFGFSGKPLLDLEMNVVGVLISKVLVRGNWYGVAETLRQRIFQE